MAPQPKKIAVIGAGVAGLQVATQLKHAGYEVSILEKSDHVGGVWKSNYAGYALQGYRPIARTLFSSPDLQQRAGYVEDSSEGVNYEYQWLYRNVLPADLSNLAFVGQLATFQHVLTTALQSRWLVDVLGGSVKVPDRAGLEADVKKQQDYWKKFPVSRSNNYVWAQHGKYHDSLVKDIRGRTNAYARWNLPGELFGYITNQRYAPLFPAHRSLRAKVVGAEAVKPVAAANGVRVAAAQA
eukprot:scaffold7.g3720.t1